MSEVMTAGSIDLASLYASMLSTSHNNSARAGHHAGTPATKSGTPDIPVAHQCEQIDELWFELGYCVHHWRGHSVEFIASRFTNMHYTLTPKTGYGYPPEEVWQHLIQRINERVYGRLVVMRVKDDTPGVVCVWK